MTILITGGTGFLGSTLAHLLVEKEDARLLLFDLFPDADAVADIAQNATIVRGDFSEATELIRVIRQHRITDVFHLAYYTAESETFPAQAIRVNCGGTNAVFECARAAGVRRVVWASSAAVYGTGTTSADPVVHSEADPTGPTSIYGACKLFNEHVAEVYAERYGFDHVALRLCAVFGPGRGRRRGVPQDFYSSLLDSSERGELVHGPPADHVLMFGYVKDAAAAFHAAYAAESPPHRIYNFAGPAVTVAEAAEIVGRHCPSAKVSFADAGTRHLAYVSGQRIREELGCAPAYSPEAAMVDYLEQLRSTRT